MSNVNEVIALLNKREAMKKRIKEELNIRQYGYYGPPSAGYTPSTQVPITTPPTVIAQQAQALAQKKAGWGWAFLIVGGGILVFWGIPLLQNKGVAQPGMSKPQGYIPTRSSPGV